MVEPTAPDNPGQGGDQNAEAQQAPAQETTGSAGEQCSSDTVVMNLERNRQANALTQQLAQLVQEEDNQSQKGSDMSGFRGPAATALFFWQSVVSVSLDVASEVPDLKVIGHQFLVLRWESGGLNMRYEIWFDWAGVANYTLWLDCGMLQGGHDTHHPESEVAKQAFARYAQARAHK